jgi:hypothetical protein
MSGEIFLVQKTAPFDEVQEKGTFTCGVHRNPVSMKNGSSISRQPGYGLQSSIPRRDTGFSLRHCVQGHIQPPTQRVPGVKRSRREANQ